MDAYRIGVSIAMQSNGAEVLSALSRSLLGVNVAAKDVERSFGRIHLAAIGLGAVLGGSAVVGGMMRLAEAGRDFAHQQSVMLQGAVSHRDVAIATAAAWQTAANVMGSSAASNLALIGDLRNQLGSLDEAISVTATMAKMGVFLQNLTGQDQERVAYQGVRFLDQRGALVDPATHEISGAHLEQQARLLEAIAAGTRGRVGPNELLMFQQYARLAGASLSDQGLINLAPVIGASGNASTVGTQLSSLQQQLRGGVMTQAGATWLERMGVLDARRVHIGRGGHLTIDNGALSGASELQTDPVGWVRDVLRPALVAHGLTTTDAQAGALLQSHLRSTVIGLVGEILRNLPAFARDAANILAAQGVDQYGVSQGTDPTAKMNNFSTAWKNLTTALGLPIVTDATGVIGKFAGAMNNLAQVLRQHPRLVENMELGVAAFGGVVALSGGIAITGAALRPFTAGLGALVRITAGAEAAAAATSLLGLATGIGAIVAAAGIGAYGIGKLSGYLDHKYGYDTPEGMAAWAKQPWYDKIDPFQLWHTMPHQAAGATLNVTVPLHLDGKEIGRASAKHSLNQLINDARSSSGTFDDWGSPRLPSVAGAH